MKLWKVKNKCLGLFIFLIFSLIYSRLEAQVSSISDSLQIRIFQDRAEFWYVENFDSVLKYSSAVIDIAKRNGEKFLNEQLDALLRICWASGLYNRLPETFRHLNEGIQLLDRFPGKIASFDTNGYYRSAVIFTKGMYSFEQGNYKDAITEFSRVVPLSGQPLTTDFDLLYSTCSFLGQSYFKAGNYDRASQYYELGLEYKQQPGVASDKNPMSYLYEGQYNFAIGKTAESFTLFHKALDILSKEKLSKVRNTLHSNYLLIAGYYMKSAEFDRAVSMIRRSIDIAGENTSMLCYSFCTLGEAYYSNKMFDSAVYNFNRALDLIKSSEVALLPLKYRPIWGIANIERDKRNYTKAEQYYIDAFTNIELSAQTGSDLSIPSIQVIPFMNLIVDRAQLYFSRFITERKKDFADTCISLLERALIVSDQGRRGLFRMDTKEAKAELQSRITGLGIEASFRAFECNGNRNYLWKAFYFIEKNKGNILHDKADDLRALSFSGIPDDILDKERRIKDDLRLLETEVRNLKENDPVSEEIKNHYNSQFREYITFTELLEKEYPHYYNLKYDASIPEISTIRKHISDRTLLIQFYVTDTIIYALSLSRKSIYFVRIKNSAELKQNLNIILNQMGDSDISERVNSPYYFKEFCNASRYIYKTIVEPVLIKTSSKINKLVIIPEDVLCRIPFELLLTREYAGDNNYSRLPYLVNDMEVRYDYSVSLLCENNKTGSKYRKSYVGFAPEYNPESESSSTKGFSSLIAVGREIELCRRIWNGESWSGPDATELMFRKHFADGKIIHLGIHTYINDEDPFTSYLAFSADENSDARVNIFEIYNLDIPADLIILSGCETGIGQIKKGEGIMSLARAFKYAGCGNIIMSLWKVNDKAACDIIIAFNKNLRKGMPKDRALQKAKKAFLRHSENAHPAFWSSFVLIGNNKPVKNSNTLYFLIPAFLVMVIFLMKRKKIR